MGSLYVHDCVRRNPEAAGLGRDTRDRELLLRASHAWWNTRRRPVHDPGGGGIIDSDSDFRSLPHTVDPGVYAMNEPVLEMKDVVKYYGDTAVLNGVSFRVLRGETKIIIGASGSGKSTILKLMMGLDKPDEGHIFVEGDDVAGMNEQQLFSVRQKMGMVFQESALFDS